MRASVQQYRACADFSGCELEERRRLHHLRESARRTSRRSGRSVCAVFQRSSADGGYPPNTLLIVERLAQPECKLRYHLQIYERLSDNLRYVCLIALAGPEVEQNSGRGGEARGNRNSSVAIADKFGLPQRGRRERQARTVWRVHHGQISLRQGDLRQLQAFFAQQQPARAALVHAVQPAAGRELTLS